MKGLWKRAGIGSVALVTMLGAFGAITSPAFADLGTWKVVKGHIKQRVDWTTSSTGDNGCYTHIFGDTGTATISYQAVQGAKVELQKPGPSNYGLNPGLDNGVPFSGTDKQTAEYRLKSQRDENASQSCGPDPLKPPNTRGCKTARVRSQPFHLYWDPARGVFLDGIVSQPKWFRYKCPSDDAYSVITVNANSGVDAREFDHHNEVRLAGHATDPTKQYLSYPLFDNHHGSQTATIDWALTLKRVHHR